MKDITFEVLVEHVCDANYIMDEDPFDFPRPFNIIFEGRLLVSSETLKMSGLLYNIF